MRDYSSITDRVKMALRLHFQNGIPIEHLDITKPQMGILSRVEYAYQMFLEDQSVDIYHTLVELNQMHYKGGFETQSGMSVACSNSRRQELMVLYVIEMMHPELMPDR